MLREASPNRRGTDDASEHHDFDTWKGFVAGGGGPGRRLTWCYRLEFVDWDLRDGLALLRLKKFREGQRYLKPSMFKIRLGEYNKLSRLPEPVIRETVELLCIKLYHRGTIRSRESRSVWTCNP